MQQVNQTEVMEQNLERIINQNCFSSLLIEFNSLDEQPANPFRKKMFDKNLRRSAISSDHSDSISPYNKIPTETNLSAQNYFNTRNNRDSEIKNINSSRNSLISPFNQHKTPTQDLTQRQTQQLSQRPNQQLLQRPNQQLPQQPNQELPQQPAEKLPLRPTQSLPQRPTQELPQKPRLSTNCNILDLQKEQITSIINSFRFELDYLEQKLHKKVDEFKCQQNTSQSYSSREVQINFMIGSLEKIVGFMIENCVNLEDTLFYGYTQQYSDHKTNTIKPQLFDNLVNQNENITFAQEHYAINSIQQSNRPKKIVRFKQEDKENIGTELNHMPNTFYINDKLHSNEKTRYEKGKKQQLKRNIQQNLKPTHRGGSKCRRQNLMNQSDYNYFSNKNNFSHSYTSSVPENLNGNKSIYETVLEERQMRLKMKKRAV